MSKIVEVILSLGLVIGLQIIVYIVFLRTKIMAWGASPEEARMALIGDDRAPTISSTRAISIQAPDSEVWKWINQLGADRGGWFSYSLVEKLLGYEMRPANPVPQFQDLQVGSIVRASIDDSKSLIPYRFPVVAVQPGRALVLENWGTLALRELHAKQTRLIVRTHGSQLPDLKSRILDLISAPLHYIMERRMLMGIKAQVEGMQLSATSDNLWLLGVLFSGLGLAWMIVGGQGIQNVFLSAVLGIAWLLVLLIAEPHPKYSLGLSLIEVVTILINSF